MENFLNRYEMAIRAFLVGFATATALAILLLQTVGC